MWNGILPPSASVKDLNRISEAQVCQSFLSDIDTKYNIIGAFIDVVSVICLANGQAIVNEILRISQQNV
jgi:hypothetical protein